MEFLDCVLEDVGVLGQVVLATHLKVLKSQGVRSLTTVLVNALCHCVDVIAQSFLISFMFEVLLDCVDNIGVLVESTLDMLQENS